MKPGLSKIRAFFAPLTIFEDFSLNRLCVCSNCRFKTQTVLHPFFRFPFYTFFRSFLNSHVLFSPFSFRLSAFFRDMRSPSPSVSFACKTTASGTTLVSFACGTIKSGRPCSPARQQAGHSLMLFSERANYAFFPEGRFPSCFRREKKPADQLSLFLLCSFLPGFSVSFSP